MLQTAIPTSAPPLVDGPGQTPEQSAYIAGQANMRRIFRRLLTDAINAHDRAGDRYGALALGGVLREMNALDIDTPVGDTPSVTE